MDKTNKEVETTSDEEYDTRTHAEKVEADKRYILEHLIRLNLKACSSQREIFRSHSRSQRRTESASEEVNPDGAAQSGSKKDEDYEPNDEEVAEEYERIFGKDDDDDDDIDELFDEIVKKAEIAFAKEQELKRKNPFYDEMQDLFKKPKRQGRKAKKRQTVTKQVQHQLDAMNFFKRELNAASSNQDPNSSSSAVCTRGPDDSRQSNLGRNRLVKTANSQFTIYPKWRTTATYTPIFSHNYNPNWVKKQPSPYTGLPTPTPKRIADGRIKDAEYRWTSGPSSGLKTGASSGMQIGTSSGPPSAPLTSRSLKSVAATCSSEKDDINSPSCVGSPIHASTPLPRSVRFTSSPPQCIPCTPESSFCSNIDCNQPRSSVVRFTDSAPQCIPCSPDTNVYLNCQDGNNEFSPPIYHRGFEQNDQNFEQFNSPSNIQFRNNNETQQPFIQRVTYERSDTITVRGTENDPRRPFVQQPQLYNNFIRNLNANLNQNYNMTVKYSMKVKYF